MNELLKKPEPEAFAKLAKKGALRWAQAERDYWQRIARYAIGALNEITHCETAKSAKGIANIALSSIKHSEGQANGQA